jgi:hypothetical protein
MFPPVHRTAVEAGSGLLPICVRPCKLRRT